MESQFPRGKMHWLSHILILFVLFFPTSLSLIEDFGRANSSDSSSNHLGFDLTPEDASPNFFTSDLGSYESPSSAPDYGAAFFDHFPDLGYFPEFGEIFRLSRTTTPRPPFRFPEYVREAFSTEGHYKGQPSEPSRRRPPRPASSSSSRTKVSKGQSEPKDKGSRSLKNNKSPAIKAAKTFPKIFRFTQDRVNLAEFDSKKKVNENYLTLTKGDELDSEKVKRNEFLILHGGVFEIESNRREGLVASGSQPDVTLADPAKRDKRELLNVPYFYKR